MDNPCEQLTVRDAKGTRVSSYSAFYVSANLSRRSNKSNSILGFTVSDLFPVQFTERLNSIPDDFSNYPCFVQ